MLFEGVKKLRQWIIKAENIEEQTSIMMFGEIYTDKQKAKNKISELNKNLGHLGYKHTLIELVEVEEPSKLLCEMTDEEEKEYNEEIMSMQKDLVNIVQYDEWSAREYGDTKVDYNWTAISLYESGYRKVKEIRREADGK
jgi:hypothetical protein